MILNDFPDIVWLKRQIEENFRSRKSFHGLELEHEGFPSVVINTKVNQSYRPDVRGPISLFMNLEGTSRCKVNNKTVVVPQGFFFVSNRFQQYSLEIESNKPVETFNIHMGEFFSEGVLSGILSPTDVLLNENQHQNKSTVTFSNQLYKRDEKFDRLIMMLKNYGRDKLLFEEALVDIFSYLMLQHRFVMKTIQQLPSTKLSTKIDLYKRLAVVIDYLNSVTDYDIDLNKLASLTNLSKYHFMRLFRQAYGVSPYQYVQKLRLDKAEKWLRTRSYSIKEIAFQLGFENSNSFSRLFYQRTGTYPQAYQRK